MAWTSPRTWLAGEEPTAAILNAHIRDNLKAIGDGGMTAYTPTWGASGSAPALGNGTITGNYHQYGKWVYFWVRLLMGSTTTFGTGNYSFTYPVTAAQVYNPALSGRVFDTSASQIMSITGSNLTTSTFRMAAATAHVSPTAPITFANGDEILIGGTYEAA